MTIQEVKRKSSGHFFDRETMRHFGDTMRSFGTKTIAGQVYVYRKTGKKAVWEFHEVSGKLKYVLIENNPEIYNQIY